MLNKLRNYWSIFTSYFLHAQKRKVLAIIAIIAVVVALPLTIFIAQQQQDLRQRASEFEVTPPYLTLPFTTAPFPPSIITCEPPFIVEAYSNGNDEAKLIWGSSELAYQFGIEWRRLTSKAEWQSGAYISTVAIENLWNSVQPMGRVTTEVEGKKGFIIPDLDKNYAYGVRVRIGENEKESCEGPSEWSAIRTFTTF